MSRNKRSASKFAVVFLTRQSGDRPERCFLTELAFDLNEVLIAEWKDYNTKSVIVATSARGQTIPQRMIRRLKHLSVIACVLTAGESLTPYIVKDRVSL
jgi:hypothetical protein